MALFRYIVAQEGITVIMATHDPVVEEYAHVVYELGDGQVQAVRRLGSGQGRLRRADPRGR
jgi:ABC-type lipoprotein export system ATPase subunit